MFPRFFVYLSLAVNLLLSAHVLSVGAESAGQPAADRRAPADREAAVGGALQDSPGALTHNASLPRLPLIIAVARPAVLLNPSTSPLCTLFVLSLCLWHVMPLPLASALAVYFSGIFSSPLLCRAVVHRVCHDAVSLHCVWSLWKEMLYNSVWLSDILNVFFQVNYPIEMVRHRVSVLG